jgi:hypothetical protein
VTFLRGPRGNELRRASVFGARRLAGVGSIARRRGNRQIVRRLSGASVLRRSQFRLSLGSGTMMDVGIDDAIGVRVFPVPSIVVSPAHTDRLHTGQRRIGHWLHSWTSGGLCRASRCVALQETSRSGRTAGLSTGCILPARFLSSRENLPPICSVFGRDH